MQLKTLLVFYFVTIRSLSLIKSWRACQERSRSMGLTETPSPPPLLLLKCFWLLLRRYLKLGSLIPPRKSFWIMQDAAIKLLMRTLMPRCRPWRRTTSCCPFHTGSDTKFQQLYSFLGGGASTSDSGLDTVESIHWPFMGFFWVFFFLNTRCTQLEWKTV